MSLATKVAVMNNGVIAQLGSPQELYDTPNCVFVADFIGSPSMNFIKGHARTSDGKVRFIADNDGPEVSIPIDHYAFDKEVSDGQELILGIRPEYITGNTADHRGAAAVDFELTPTLWETSGFDQHVQFEFCSGEISGRFSSKEPIVIGESVKVHMDLSAISLFDANSEERI